MKLFLLTLISFFKLCLPAYSLPYWVDSMADDYCVLLNLRVNHQNALDQIMNNHRHYQEEISQASRAGTFSRMLKYSK